MYRLLTLVLSVIIVGCSNKAVYDNIQLNNRRACNDVPASQYAECIERVSKTYEEYKRDREE